VAKAILAHRIARRTMRHPKRRMALKLAWVRELFRFRFKEEEIQLLFHALRGRGVGSSVWGFSTVVFSIQGQAIRWIAPPFVWDGRAGYLGRIG
jgi:hypothetical protein